MSEFKEKLDALCDSYELEIYALDSALQRVRELHKPYTDELSINGYTGEAFVYCSVCFEKYKSGSIFTNDPAIRIEYPCPTIKALDGEQ